jgi:hypothetical protein
MQQIDVAVGRPIDNVVRIVAGDIARAIQIDNDTARPRQSIA